METLNIHQPDCGDVGPVRRGLCQLEFFYNKKVWRGWVWAVHDLVVDWDGFDHWNWGNFSNVRTMGINKLLGPDL
jgi:hypothetical protein